MKDQPERQERYIGLGEDYYWLGGQNDIVESLFRPALRAAPPGNGGPPRLLDLGCGAGFLLRRFEDTAVGIGSDFSLEALAHARKAGSRRVLSSDSTALPFRSGTFDGVVCLDVLEHIEDDRAALREIARVLRPGGVFLFAVPAFPALWRDHDEMYGHFRRYRRHDFVARVRDAGLEVQDCRFIKIAFFVPLFAIAVYQRHAAGRRPPRDNFYAVPRWLNRLLRALIVGEHRLGVTRVAPLGVSLVCLGRR